MPRAGRPSKIDDLVLLPDGKGGQTPRVRWEVIVERVRAGAYPEVAAASVGVARTTFYRWMAEAEDRYEGSKRLRARPELRDFRDAIDRAKAEAELLHVARIQKAGETDWKASAWYLERSRPERFRRRDTVHQAGPGEGDPELPPRRVIHDLDEAAPSKLADLLDLVERAGSRPPAGPGDGGPPVD